MDIELEVLREQFFSAHSKRNARVMACRLPAEVLTSIFMCVQAIWRPSKPQSKDMPYGAGWTAITRVCNSWRKARPTLSDIVILRSFIVLGRSEYALVVVWHRLLEHTSRLPHGRRLSLQGPAFVLVHRWKCLQSSAGRLALRSSQQAHKTADYLLVFATRVLRLGGAPVFCHASSRDTHYCCQKRRRPRPQPSLPSGQVSGRILPFAFENSSSKWCSVSLELSATVSQSHSTPPLGQ